MDALNCKEIIDFYADEKKEKMFQLLKKRWDILKELEYILKIPYRATISLQKRDLTLSDVFGIWMIMKLHLNQCTTKKQYKTKLPAYLLVAIENRKEVIFNNPFMVCALFLDPRFRREITTDELKCAEAKSTLLKVWQRVNKSEAQLNNSESSNEISFEFDEQAALENYFSGTRNTAHSTTLNVNSSGNIDLILDLFDPQQQPTGKNVLDYWEETKKEQPELYKLAAVIFAIPPTEVPIERDFSRLNFVFTDRRCRLTEERLEDIMLLHINPDLFESVKKEELKDAFEKYAKWKPVQMSLANKCLSDIF